MAQHKLLLQQEQQQQRRLQVCIGRRNTCAGVAHTRRAHVCACQPKAAASKWTLQEDIKRIVKKVQGSLPLVGLFSRLVSPEGGFDETNFSEFRRHLYNDSQPSFRAAVTDLEEKYGKVASAKLMFALLWMAKYGTGLVPPMQIMNAAKRLRVTQDLEIEIDRFEYKRDESLKRYSYVDRPIAKVEEQIDVAVDAICLMSIGLAQDKELPDEDIQRICNLVCGALPDASGDSIKASLQKRQTRKYS